ncbi:MAG TPA: zf-HC2 domain-containing protein [Terriglobia bacterium]|nr:zf-HC2 domain-containing protein [Terriglobia bacterium]
MKTPKTCVEKEQIFAYVHHMLHEGEAGRVEAHLASCAECHKIAEGFQRLDSVLGEWKPAEPSPWFDARARARVAAQARPWRYLPRLGWRGWSAVAAAAVVAMVVSVAMLRPPRSTHGVRNMEATVSATPAPRKSDAAPAPASPAANETSEAANASTGPAATADGGTATVAQTQPATQEIDLYKNLNVLENYDMLANFDVLSELPQASSSTSD